jgi:hypothetical protein
MPCPCCAPPWNCPCPAPASVTLTMTGPPSGTNFNGQPDLVSPCNGTHVLTRDIDYETRASNGYAYYSLSPSNQGWDSWFLTGWRDVPDGSVYALAFIACYPGSFGPGPSVGLQGFSFRKKPRPNEYLYSNVYAYSSNVNWPGFPNQNNNTWSPPIGACSTSATGGSSYPLTWINNFGRYTSPSANYSETYYQAGLVYATIGY